MKEVVGIRFKKAGKMYYFDPAGLKLEKEDGAIVETARGVEYGDITGGIKEVDEDEIVEQLYVRHALGGRECAAFHVPFQLPSCLGRFLYVMLS